MINTSGGIGKIKLSINDIIARKNFELLCAANSIDFLYSSLNIFSFIIINEIKNQIGHDVEYINRNSKKQITGNH